MIFWLFFKCIPRVFSRNVARIFYWRYTNCISSSLFTAKICLFYSIFYGVLAALVAICMWVFFQTLDPRTPTWQLDKSIIGTNPGLGFRPLPPEDQVESTLIWYKGSGKENFKFWTDSLENFIAGEHPTTQPYSVYIRNLCIR